LTLPSLFVAQNLQGKSYERLRQNGFWSVYWGSKRLSFRSANRSGPHGPATVSRHVQATHPGRPTLNKQSSRQQRTRRTRPIRPIQSLASRDGSLFCLSAASSSATNRRCQKDCHRPLAHYEFVTVNRLRLVSS
jgi:hypothetical protein